jgi:hypothetical protein
MQQTIRMLTPHWEELVPATVAGKEISARISNDSTKPNEMLKASTHGEVRVGAENIKQKICGCWLSK